MSPDREDLHRELAAAVDHPRAFAEAILGYAPSIRKSYNRLIIKFDECEQATDAHDLLWNAINSIKPASEE